MKKSELGKLGEDFTCEFLKRKGYRILERNCRRPWGEIDIIAHAPKGTLVFVEVKAMRQGKLLPEDHLTRAKLRRLQRTAELLSNGDYADESRRGWQIDLVALSMDGNGDFSRTTHYENIGGRRD